MQTASNDWVKELLEEIREISNVLKTRVHNEAEQCYEDDKGKEMKHNWMLAAAVLDRIFSIVFTIVFVVGTLAFIIAFAGNVRI